MRTASPCSVPGCPQVAVQQGRCADHAAQYARQADAGRPSPSRRGYDRQWQHIRRAYLNRYPLCQRADCGEWACDVHHIIALAEGGTHDEANLMGLCHRHHSEVTGQTQAWGHGR